MSTQQKSSFFFQMVQAVPWTWDCSTKVLSVPSDFFRLLGISPGRESVRFKSILHLLENLLNEPQRYSLLEANRNCLYTGEAYTLRFFISVEEQVPKWVRVSGKGIMKAGEVVEIEGILQDISKQKSEEEQLIFAQFAVDKAAFYVLLLASDGRILYANESLLKELQQSKKGLQGRYFFEIDAQYNNKLWQHHFQHLRIHTHIQEESYFVRNDGGVIPVELNLVHLRRAKREVVYVFAKNISFQKEQIRALEKANLDIQRLTAQLATEELTLSEVKMSNEYFSNIITKNVSYRKMLLQLKEVASTNTTILILGETGTGKELLADAVHQFSSRKDQPLIKVNCAALPAGLIESELFGHERGAFTGAAQQRMGRFELANGGTLFLDEVGEIPLETQAKLLRVLQQGEFERVGGMETIRVDVRIVAATNRSLMEMVATGNFRRDLFYRLNVFPVKNIPLRQRKDDIPLLVKYFVQKYAKQTGKEITSVNKTTIQKLEKYDYPGNVRELENIIERGVILAKSGQLDLSQVFPTIEVQEQMQHFKTFEEMQCDYILKALRLTNWRISGDQGAANLLGMNPKTLESKMRKWHIKRPTHRDF